VLIPSIDVMGGKIVQLVQGEKKALEFDHFEEWVARFSSFPIIQLIDLDAAMGKAANADLMRLFVLKLPCQVGGGIRSIEAARAMLTMGSRRVIVGSRLIRHGRIDVGFAAEIAQAVGSDRLVFAIDSRRGKVAIRGWREATTIGPLEMIRALEPHCCAFLYTHVDTEGTLSGLPLEPIRKLREATSKQLIAAGGIATAEEITELDRMGVDAVVGMALYLGKINLPDSISPSR
jgi:phosphoribosylformimino-5-aminoimidazole carboxamide ribotide isomerase